jgi:hypothetical protein
MPTCSSCHPAAITVAHTASAVRDLGFAGALWTAAASVLRIGCKRGLSDAPAARSAASDADANQTHLPAAVPPFGRRFAGKSNRLIETAPVGRGSQLARPTSSFSLPRARKSVLEGFR